jgi:FdhD protein
MSVRNYRGIKIDRGLQHWVNDTLSVEHPLQIYLDHEPFVMTMQTPGDEIDLARGLLFTEGIIKNRTGIIPIHILETNDNGYVSALKITTEGLQLDRSMISKRNLLSAVSCGICGKTSLNEPHGTLDLADDSTQFAPLKEMFNAMQSHQKSFGESGGCHAASVFDASFGHLVTREDIGRHNAVDKAIGHLLNSEQLSAARWLLVSGRLSYEIVAKTFAAGIPYLCSVSAPSSLAVDFAEELGITLMAFCRDTRATVYTHPKRLGLIK